MVVGEHTFFAGEVVEAGFLKDEAHDVLRMEDTRMNYGGLGPRTPTFVRLGRALSPTSGRRRTPAVNLGQR